MKQPLRCVRLWSVMVLGLLGAAPAVQAAKDFTIAVSPTTASVAQGASSLYQVTVTPSGGFNSALTASLSGLPSGATSDPLSFCVLSTTSPFNVYTSVSTPTGSYTLTFTCSGGGKTHSATATMTVSAPDFALWASQGSRSVTQGGSAAYTVNISGLKGQQSEITASDRVFNDSFGASAAMSGNLAVIGAFNKNNAQGQPQGAAYMFDLTNPAAPVQKSRLMYSDGATNDDFGTTVSISANLVLVSAPRQTIGANSLQGSAYLYDVTNPAAPVLRSKLTASDGAAFDRFGAGLAISGNIAVAGALSAVNNSGAAYVFDLSNPAAPVQKAKFTSGVAGNHFGQIVSISGNVVVVAEAGIAAYVFDVTNPAAPVQKSQITLPAGISSMAISGNILVLGSAYATVGANAIQGDAYVYDITNPVAPVQKSILTASDGGAHEYFGSGVAISGNTVVVGSYKTISGNINQGAAYVYDITNPVAPVQKSILTASDGAAYNYLGASAALSGNSVLLGASGKSAAYVFGNDGFLGAVSLSPGVLPTGASAGFSPNPVNGSSSSTATISTISTTPPGSYPITFTGTSGSVSHPAAVNLYVNGTGADFSLAASPTTQAAAPNGQGDGSANYTITLAGTGGFYDVSSFTISGAPPGGSASISPTSITGSGSATLTVSAHSPSTPFGAYSVTVTALSQLGLTHSTTVTFNFVSCLPSFTWNVVPTTQTVWQGGLASYTNTISGNSCYNATTTFTATGAPAGANASFQPQSLTGSGTSVLSVLTTPSTAAGSSTITEHQSGSSLTFPVTMTVTASTTKFNVTSAPTSRSIVQGTSTTYAVTVTYLAGNFHGTVALAAAGLPVGTTAGFNPASFTATGTSTLTITSSASSPTGTYTIALTGSSGTEGKVAQVTLTITPLVGTVSGTVTQSNGTTPIAGARVEYYQNAALLGFVISASNGSYSIPNLSPGNYTFFTSASGYKTYVLSPVTATGSGATTQNFSLPVLPASGSNGKEYIRLNGKVLAIESGASGPPLIDFEQFTGQNQGDYTALPPLTVGIATFSGGQLVPDIQNCPACVGVVYGSYHVPGKACVGCIITLTITFALPVSNFSADVINGETNSLTYTISDDRGGQTQVTLGPNFQYGADRITLPSSHIQTVTFTGGNSSTDYDLWWDNIRFTVD